MQRSYSYDDWGRLTGGSDAVGFNGLDRPRWKGAIDLTAPGGELYFMRSRWYEPYTGRFLSDDPNGLAGGVNEYAYAGNDPANHIDPTGETWTCNVLFQIDVGTQDNPILITPKISRCTDSEPAETWMRDARWGYGVDAYAIAPVLGPLPTPPPAGRRAPVLLNPGAKHTEHTFAACGRQAASAVVSLGLDLVDAKLLEPVMKMGTTFMRNPSRVVATFEHAGVALYGMASNARTLVRDPLSLEGGAAMLGLGLDVAVHTGIINDLPWVGTTIETTMAVYDCGMATYDYLH